MFYLNGIPVLSGDIHWQFGPGRPGEEEGLRLALHLSSFSRQYQRRQALKAIEGVLARNNATWIKPGLREWTLDLDAIRQVFSPLNGVAWLTGTVAIEPEFETQEREVFDSVTYEASVTFYIIPTEFRRMSNLSDPPVEIKESLQRFQVDHPDPKKVAFIMMQFGKTRAHDDIIRAITDSLAAAGIAGLRADEKQYHDDLFPNVLTYIYGCGFGIAVFERLEAEQFNPNVSLEVGYMFALRKPTCLLKDRTLKTLHTDLVGKIYREFDPQDPIGSIPDQLKQWMSDKGIG